MGLAKHVVVHIVGRSNLETTGTKLDINITVLYYWNHAVHEWNNHLLATQPLVLEVLGVNTHCSVTHDGLGTCGGNHSITASLSVTVNNLTLFSCFASHIVVSNIILQIVKFALLFTVDNLLVAECSLSLGVPVHHAKSTIDQPLLIKVYKDTQHALAADFVHGESSAAPVA